MRLSLTMLVRMAVFSGLGLCVVAVGLGRMNDPSPQWRQLRPVRDVNVHNFLLGAADRNPRMLDVVTGRIRRIELPEGDLLERPSVANRLRGVA